MYDHKLPFIAEKFSGWPRIVQHLVGVAEILKKEDAPEYLQVAGLYHSIYGEEMSGNFGYGLITREELKKQIGEQSEEVVHAWCALSDTSRELAIERIEDVQLKKDLYKIHNANEKEMKGG